MVAQMGDGELVEVELQDAVVVPIEDALDLHPFRPREILEVVDGAQPFEAAAGRAACQHMLSRLC